MNASLMHAPLACSLAVRFAAAEGAVPLSIKFLNLGTKKFETGGTLYDLNPLGQVSVLKLEDGQILTETSSCLLWTQSQSLDAGFVRKPDGDDYFQMIRWISFCSTELHKQIFRIVFYDEATDDVKERIRGLAPKRFELLEVHLTDRQFLVGDTFSAADAYLTWFFVLAEKAQLQTSGYKKLLAYRDRMFARPKISALIAEDYAKSREMS